MNSLGTHSLSFHTVAVLASSFLSKIMESKEERHNHAHFLLFFFSYLCDLFPIFPTSSHGFMRNRKCKFLYYLPASLQKSIWLCYGTSCCETHGNKTMKLNPQVCNITLLLLFPFAQHSSANLIVTQAAEHLEHLHHLVLPHRDKSFCGPKKSERVAWAIPCEIPV